MLNTAYNQEKMMKG